MALRARRPVAILLALLLASGVMFISMALFSGIASGAATFTVTLATDTLPNGVQGELRWAINQANLDSEMDTIDSAQDGFVITPLAALPPIDEPVFIDGVSPRETGYVYVYIDGSLASLAGNCDGLTFVAGSDGSRVVGLSTYNFNSTGHAGISIDGADGIQIDGSYSGIASSYVVQPNYYGVLLENGATDNTIGANEDGEYANLISGNTSHGVYINGCSGNDISGNYIGTNQLGTAAIANRGDGVHLQGGSNENFIGWFNLISGNISDGIEIDGSTGNLVSGNFIGTDINGTADVGNEGNGVLLTNSADENFLGPVIGMGSSPGGEPLAPTLGTFQPNNMNVISGNDSDGVCIVESDNNFLAGNFIGTDADGIADLGNEENGVCLVGSDKNYIGIGAFVSPELGGTVKLKLPSGFGVIQLQNLISGNGLNGIYMDASTGNSVNSNAIGLGLETDINIPNGLDGIYIYNSNDNIVGGYIYTGNDNIIGASIENPNAIGFNNRDGVGIRRSVGCLVNNNVIALNDRTGVVVWDKYSYSDTISQNIIYANGALGISLGGSATPKPNDGNNDNPNKPNRGFNYPVFSSDNFDIEGGNVLVSGTAPALSIVEIFLTGDPDPSGHGEGLTYLGTVNADASCNFSTTLSGRSAGDYITATATAPGLKERRPGLVPITVAGSTSEFSGNAAIGGPKLEIIKAVELAKQSPGSDVTYTITIRNNGLSDANNVTFNDEIPDHTSVVAGSLTCSDSGATKASEDPVKVTGITVKSGKTVTITFKVKIDEDVPSGTIISNQGEITYGGRAYPSSDPDHPGDDRPTDVTVESAEKTLGSREWFIAEGSTGGGFDTWILLQNQQEEQAKVKLTFTTDDGPSKPLSISIEPESRTSIRVADYVPDTWGVSSIIEADNPILAERSMYWDKTRIGDTDIPGTPQPYEMKGGSSNLGVPVEALTGEGTLNATGGRSNYFPEGATAGGFDTWVLLVNPNEQEAHAKVTLMTGEGATMEKDLTVGALSRQTVHLDELLPNAFEVATEVTSDVPLVAERSMYWDPDAAILEPYQMIGGHSNAGSPTANKNWFLAEGATAGGFDTYILLQNPNDSKAAVTTEFMVEDGVAKKAKMTMAPMSRATIKVSDYVADNFQVSARVTSDRSIVVERSTYWDKRFAAQPYEMRDGTSTVGLTRSGSTWLTPEGSTGVGFDTFVLITNTEDEPVDAVVVFLTQQGIARQEPITIPAVSRYTVRLSDYVPDQFQVSTVVLGEGHLVVERSMYWDKREMSPSGEPEIRPYEMMGGHSSSGVDP